MSACPKCGFSFAWNGLTCGHCHHGEDWVAPPVSEDDRNEVRILHTAGKHKLPHGPTKYFQDLAPQEQEQIVRSADARIHGRAVLICLDSVTKWTLLTTREVICLDHGRIRAIGFAEIESVHPYPALSEHADSEAIGHWKSNWEYLRILDGQCSETIVWVPRAPNSYAMWNILERVASE